MARITESDYKKLAEAVSNDLIQGQIPLNESISKLATSMALNQEQVHRLCEAANNTTFGALFASRDKTASDRIVEFDIADADKVLGHVIKEAAHHDGLDEAVSLYEYRSLAEVSEDPFDKTAAAPPEEPVEVVTQRSAERDVRTLRKTLSELRHMKTASEYAYMDAVQSLHSRFKRLYLDESFTAFEKNAVALHGENAVKPLADMRKRLRMPEVNYNFAALKKEASYIDDSSLDYKLLAEAVAASDKLQTIQAGISKLEARV